MTKRINEVRTLGTAGVVVGVVLLPWGLGADRLAFETGTATMILALLSFGTFLLYSQLGELSLASPLFFATGAYVAALGTRTWDFSPLVTLPLALGVAVALAALLGVATLRARHLGFALVTYAALIVGQSIVYNTSALGGSDGIVGLPHVTIDVLGDAGRLTTPASRYFVAVALMGFGLGFCALLVRSRLGTRARMLRDAPMLARSVGVRAGPTRSWVFILAAVPPAYGGWYYALHRSYVGPDMFAVYFLLVSILAGVVFGRTWIIGPVVAAAALQLQQNYLSFGANGNAMVLGAVLVAMLLIGDVTLPGFVRRRLEGTTRIPAGQLAPPPLDTRPSRSVDPMEDVTS